MFSGRLSARIRKKSAKNPVKNEDLEIQGQRSDGGGRSDFPGDDGSLFHDPERFLEENPDWEPEPEDFLSRPHARIAKGMGFGIAPRYPSSFWTILIMALMAIGSLSYWLLPGARGMAISKQSFFEDDRHWQAVTAMFCHADIEHLLSNAVFLYILSWVVHAYCGPWMFPFRALVLGALTNVITVWFYEPDMRLIGASGLVYALFGMWTHIFLRHARHLSVLRRFLHVGGCLLLLLLPQAYRPEVSYLAHAVGFLLGFVGGFYEPGGPEAAGTDTYVPLGESTSPAER